MSAASQLKLGDKARFEEQTYEIVRLVEGGVLLQKVSGVIDWSTDPTLPHRSHCPSWRCDPTKVKPASYILQPPEFKLEEGCPDVVEEKRKLAAAIVKHGVAKVVDTLWADLLIHEHKSAKDSNATKYLPNVRKPEDLPRHRLMLWGAAGAGKSSMSDNLADVLGLDPESIAKAGNDDLMAEHPWYGYIVEKYQMAVGNAYQQAMGDGIVPGLVAKYEEYVISGERSYHLQRELVNAKKLRDALMEAAPHETKIFAFAHQTEIGGMERVVARAQRNGRRMDGDFGDWERDSYGKWMALNFVQLMSIALPEDGTGANQSQKRFFFTDCTLEKPTLNEVTVENYMSLQKEVQELVDGAAASYHKLMRANCRADKLASFGFSAEGGGDATTEARAVLRTHGFLATAAAMKKGTDEEKELHRKFAWTMQEFDERAVDLMRMMAYGIRGTGQEFCGCRIGLHWMVQWAASFFQAPPQKHL